MCINYAITKKAQMIFRAVNNKLRQDIIKMILDAGEINVSDMTKNLSIEQPVVSQQLAILRKAGVAKKQRRGKFIYYIIDQEQLYFIETKAIELCK